MSARAKLQAAAADRILIFDGAFGTQIQDRKLTEQDYAGDLGLKADQKGNNDILALTRPDVIRDITRAYLDAGDRGNGWRIAAALADPDFHDKFSAIERNGLVRDKSRAMQKIAHLCVGKTKSGVLVSCTQFLKVVAGEIDDGDPSTRPCDTRCFGQWQGWVLREMQHLMQYHGVEASAGKRQITEIALDQLDLGSGKMLKLCTRDPQHFEVFIERYDPVGFFGKKFCHPPRTGSDIEQVAKRRLGQRLYQLIFDLCIRAVHCSQIIPIAGVASEITFCTFFARIADRCEFVPVRFACLGEFGILLLGGDQQSIKSGHRGSSLVRSAGRAKEDPAAFAAALCKTGVAQNSDMTRNARLTLSQDLGQFSNGKLHRAQQPRNAQSGGIGQSLEDGIDRHSVQI